MSTELVIKVALADDHKIFRDGIKMALKGKEYLKILWEAEDGKDLMHKMQIKKPDVLLMDIRMPEVDGVNAIGILRKEYSDVKMGYKLFLFRYNMPYRFNPLISVDLFRGPNLQAISYKKKRFHSHCKR